MDSKIAAVFSLYDRWGQENYIGENVTQLQHAQQAAIQAEQAGHSDLVIIGAFLHDIGHLIGMEKSLPLMEQNGIPLGTVDHDEVGENFLKDLGFPQEVTQFVRGHVQAKRYLVHTDPGYHSSLSEASKGTLVCQGGPMSAGEAAQFESLSNFSAILAMRKWDEAAKDVNIAATDNKKYKDIVRRVLAV
eukprot:GFUD01006225.1.p1 GENE.GFUD01006225.1~~GFUD01006225.1.p1  ORF type:complete len:198 (-),score=66.55 GFUD01006225.1:214-780(-)